MDPIEATITIKTSAMEVKAKIDEIIGTCSMLEHVLSDHTDEASWRAILSENIFECCQYLQDCALDEAYSCALDLVTEYGTDELDKLERSRNNDDVWEDYDVWRGDTWGNDNT